MLLKIWDSRTYKCQLLHVYGSYKTLKVAVTVYYSKIRICAIVSKIKVSTANFRLISFFQIR
jgi:hypothetical protein